MSAQKQVLLPFYQRSMVFYKRVSYHDYDGIANDIDEATRVSRDLGPRKQDTDHEKSRSSYGRGNCIGIVNANALLTLHLEGRA